METKTSDFETLRPGKFHWKLQVVKEGLLYLSHWTSMILSQAAWKYAKPNNAENIEGSAAPPLDYERVSFPAKNLTEISSEFLWNSIGLSLNDHSIHFFTRNFGPILYTDRTIYILRNFSKISEEFRWNFTGGEIQLCRSREVRSRRIFGHGQNSCQHHDERRQSSKSHHQNMHPCRCTRVSIWRHHDVIPYIYSVVDWHVQIRTTADSWCHQKYHKEKEDGPETVSPL